MKNLNIKQIVIGVLGLILIGFNLIKNSNTNSTTEPESKESVEENIQIVEFENDSKTVENLNPQQVTDDEKAGEQRLVYDGKELVLTRHAECRMGCRKISKSEVQEVIQNGKENKRKSNPDDPRCPTIALEDWTEDGQRVRIIVANCDKVAKLVTVIDLENEYHCNCN